MGYLRCFGSPNAELERLRVAAFSFAMFENLLESGRRYGLHFLAGADRVTLLAALTERREDAGSAS
jgi:hypothetical protein